MKGVDIMEIPKIASFSVDHRGMQPGIYFREDLRNGVPILTADIRFFEPNKGTYLSTLEAHSVEHVLATLLRASELSTNVIYFGPMGCRTGFYLVTLGLDKKQVLELLLKCSQQAATVTSMPGGRLEECGNYADLDLETAKASISYFIPYIQEKEYKPL
jgi:S-ribosylhomocysteine lyase